MIEYNLNYTNAFEEDELLNYYDCFIQDIRDYNPEAWACCFIEPALRRYEILQIQARIRNDSLDRVERARWKSADDAFFNSFPMAGPKRVDSTANGSYKCFKTGDGYEICGHVK